MIVSMSEQGLTFEIQTGAPALQTVGSKAALNFDFLGKHHAYNTLFIHVQGNRALLSLRDAAPAVLAALNAANRHNVPSMATSLSVLQKQRACHARFMDSMKTVVDDFYRLLPGEIEKHRQLAISHVEHSGLADLQGSLMQLRPVFTHQFTAAFPVYPERHATYAIGQKPEKTLGLVDTDEVDDWVRRTTIAQKINESITPWPHEFNRHYNALLRNDDKQIVHPYHPDSVLDAFASLLAPLDLNADKRILCYELMGQALQKEAEAMYQSMIDVIGAVPAETRPPPKTETNLSKWLETTTQEPASNAKDTFPAAAAQVDALTTLLARFAHKLDAYTEHPLKNPVSPQAPAAHIPGLLAHDRIMARFLPPGPSSVAATDPLHLPEPPTTRSEFGKTLGGLAALDDTALEGLHAQLRQPPPIDPGPDKLSDTSQVRALMQQAQGLVLQYTLNGLAYQTQPDHPAWALLNELDALHRGADDQGQFLDPTLYKATELAIQWLLGQENTDAALMQFNTLLASVNTELSAGRQSRREQHLRTLGEAVSGDGLINTGWCVIKLDGEAIPHEILGKFGDRYALLNRSATRLREIPATRFAEEVDSGLIEEAVNFDLPFLERAASATLAASLDAVHAYTWKDPASGCLRRTALMDELERRLDHPVVEPPTFCALIEIPTMRPGLSSLPGDELSIMQTRSGELLLDTLEHDEQCGRLSDVSFMIVFSPQDPHRLADRLSQLKADMESLHPSWKMIGAVVPLVAPGETAPTPSNVLRRANLACANMRLQAGFDLSCLRERRPAVSQTEPLPLSSLYLRCQKIASCDDGVPSHYEILLGIDEVLAPGHTTQSFVVMAEQSGKIYDLDAWVLRSALEWMDCNADYMDRLSGLSVNLSGNSLSFTDHVDTMVSLLANYPHLTNKLIIEVTETAAIGNLDTAAHSLRKLRKLGCRIALDDFGSGYSSYGYLRKLPLDYLKIDGIYIRNILTDKTDQALTASMVDVAHALGLKVIAEYVESEAASAWLKNLGVDYVQGYWVHKPERLDTLMLH